jgi:hypothetical protein
MTASTHLQPTPAQQPLGGGCVGVGERGAAGRRGGRSWRLGGGGGHHGVESGGTLAMTVTVTMTA